MTAIEIAKIIAKPFEGLRLKRYTCPAGFPTIGYGHRCRSDQEPIDMDIAEQLLSNDMMIAFSGVARACPGLLATDPGKLGAIIDFAFNLGVGRLQASTLRRRINQRNWPEVRKELNKWVRGGGKILPGLVARRKAESVYFS